MYQSALALHASIDPLILALLDTKAHVFCNRLNTICMDINPTDELKYVLFCASQSPFNPFCLICSGIPHGGIAGKNNELQLHIEQRAARIILKGARDLLAKKAKDLKEQAAAALTIVNRRKEEQGMSLSLPTVPSETPPDLSGPRQGGLIGGIIWLLVCLAGTASCRPELA